MLTFEIGMIGRQVLYDTTNELSVSQPCAQVLVPAVHLSRDAPSLAAAVQATEVPIDRGQLT